MIRTGGSWRQIGKAQGLPSNTTSSVLVDREGSIWVALRGWGVARWLGYQQWEGWTVAEGLSSDIIWAITRDKAGDLCVGTNLGLNRPQVACFIAPDAPADFPPPSFPNHPPPIPTPPPPTPAPPHTP